MAEAHPNELSNTVFIDVASSSQYPIVEATEEVKTEQNKLKMSVPALRQPKIIHMESKDTTPPTFSEPQNFLIVTLKGGKKLVVPSDAYHGILTAGELFRCVFCETEMVRDVICKERHKSSENHRKMLENFSHVEEFKENLIRKLNGAEHYCTICNVVVTSQKLHKHLTAEAHMRQLQMAVARALAYKPFN